MDTETKDRIRAGIDRLDGSAMDLVTQFYDILFDLAPETRQMFSADMTKQADKLMRTLSTAIESLDKTDALSKNLRVLGVRHLDYGVQEEHYGIVAIALLKALSQNIRDWSPTDQSAWSGLTHFLITEMTAGARAAQKPLTAA